MSGKKYDQGKLRWDLLPLTAVEGIVKVLTYGLDKYGEANSWRRVSDAKERYYAALMRHLAAYRKGEMIDPESKLTHLEHAACNIIFLCELEAENEQRLLKELFARSTRDSDNG